MSTVPGESRYDFWLWIVFLRFFIYQQHLSTLFSQLPKVWIIFFPQDMSVVDIFQKTLQHNSLFDIIFLFSLWIIYVDSPIIHSLWIMCGQIYSRL